MIFRIRPSKKHSITITDEQWEHCQRCGKPLGSPSAYIQKLINREITKKRRIERLRSFALNNGVS